MNKSKIYKVFQASNTKTLFIHYTLISRKKMLLTNISFVFITMMSQFSSSFTVTVIKMHNTSSSKFSLNSNSYGLIRNLNIRRTKKKEATCFKLWTNHSLNCNFLHKNAVLQTRFKIKFRAVLTENTFPWHISKYVIPIFWSQDSHKCYFYQSRFNKSNLNIPI